MFTMPSTHDHKKLAQLDQCFEFEDFSPSTIELIGKKHGSPVFIYSQKLIELSLRKCIVTIKTRRIRKNS